MTQQEATQIYVAPDATGTGWLAVTYGDPIIPNDTLVPLPLTMEIPLEEVLAMVRTFPVGRSASVIDGWDSEAQMRECGEIVLAERPAEDITLPLRWGRGHLLVHTSAGHR